MSQLHTDPLAVFEFVLLLITSLYILKLTLSEIEVIRQKYERVGPKPRSRRLMNLFAVGRIVTVSKRSLHQQQLC